MGVDAFYWFCSGFGNLLHLDNVYFSFFDTPMLGGLIAAIVQIFFCYRIYILSRSRILPAIVCAMALAAFATSWKSGIQGHQIGKFSASYSELSSSPFFIWLIGYAVVDTVIAISMTYLLLKSRSDHEKTNTILQSVVRLTVETNTISAALAIISLTLHFSLQSSNYFITPTYYLGKCYSNSLLVILNNRYFLTNGPRAGPQRTAKRDLPGIKFSSRTGQSTTVRPFGGNTESSVRIDMGNRSEHSVTDTFQMDDFTGSISKHISENPA